ncbi:MAG: 50S ribosomal protein L17 [Planctomycetia bacterium]|nr:50S ribosomal protein L17 [Planctomycetia bacterium]
MRHLKAGRRLNRNASHRLALYRNLTLALIRHERIITTVAKAKAARPFIEKLITLARKNTLHARRMVLARLGPPSKAEVRPIDAMANKEKPPEGDLRHVIAKLFNEIAPKYIDRPGGYLRILKRTERRLGDAGETAFLEFVKPGDRPARKKSAPAPAPVTAPAPVSAPEATSNQPTA